MTNDQNDHILTALRALLHGDPMPSMRDPAFAVLMSSIDALSRQTNGEAARLQAANQRLLGLCAAGLLHSQLIASMHAERELALMRQCVRPS